MGGALTFDEPCRRLNVYIPAELIAAVLAEAKRLDRSVNWVLKETVRRGLPRVAELGDVGSMGEARE